MSYKDDIETIKADIVGEGKFLEYYMHFERVYKKYKILFIGVFLILIGSFAYSKINAYQETNRIYEATLAYNKLLLDPKNSSAIADLKAKSEKLYTLFLLSNASKNEDEKLLKDLSSKAGLIGDIASYQLASLTKDLKKLESLKANEDGILKELATLEVAIIKVRNRDYTGFKEELLKIPATSQMKSTADAIAHLGVKNQ